MQPRIEGEQHPVKAFRWVTQLRPSQSPGELLRDCAIVNRHHISVFCIVSGSSEALTCENKSMRLLPCSLVPRLDAAQWNAAPHSCEIRDEQIASRRPLTNASLGCRAKVILNGTGRRRWCAESCKEVGLQNEDLFSSLFAVGILNSAGDFM
jgi:hypothetical protein